MFSTHKDSILNILDAYHSQRLSILNILDV